MGYPERKGKELSSKFRKGSLAGQYAIVLAVILAVVCASLFCTNLIARKAIQEDAHESAQVLFKRVENSLENYYENLEKIMNSIIYNPTVTEYMKVDENLDHLLGYSKVAATVSNALGLDKGIASVAFYDTSDGILFSMGKEYFGLTAEYGYTGILKRPGDNTCYFGIKIPVYNLDIERTDDLLGSCMVLVDTVELNEILSDSVAQEGAQMLLLDGNNYILASEEGVSGGVFKEEDYLDNDDYLLETRKFDMEGWRLVSVIPRKNLTRNINFLQQINLITYALVFVVLLILTVMFYRGVILPIGKMTQFMQHYTENRNQRMENLKGNEMDTLANSMNQMLDDVNDLTADLVRSHKYAYEVELERKQIQMYAYRTQINPHFLYNTFECIRAMALFHDAEDIACISEALSDMFRYSIKGDGFAEIREEVENLKEYASIIGYRFMNRYKVEFRVDEELQTQVVPKMLLQPLVENAVFHGLETTITEGCVWVDIHRSDEKGRMYMKVADNGRGMDESQIQKIKESLRQYDMNEKVPEKAHGIGIVNVYRRLNLFYGEEAGFVIESKLGRGTGIMMEFPMDKEWERKEEQNV